MKNNFQQEQAIKTIDGPVLIIAGPGTGKTFTLVERVLYMVGEKNIDPSEIMISTFTNKAAFELIDRLSTKFKESGIQKDVNDMHIGNFHTICDKILRENLIYTNLKEGYTQIDEIEQSYLIRRNINHFRNIPGYSNIINQNREVNDIVKIVNKVCEEAILERKSTNQNNQILLNITSLYEKILESYNMIDFSHKLFYTYKLIHENEEVRKKLHNQINYILIDEYQDTNTVQEKIILELLNENKNICVVGDDDQSLYRFRGASVKNILHFDKIFPEVKIIKLQQNYRSEDSIIKFYSKYMQDLILRHQELKPFRFNKLLYSDKVSGENRVIKRVVNNEDEWKEAIYQTIQDLKKCKAINNYNEVAILFNSINSPQANKLRTYLRRRGIGVYTPTTKTLLSKKEVLELIGIIYAIFKPIIDRARISRSYDIQAFLDREYENIYKIMLRDDELSDFVKRMSRYILSNDFSLNIYDIYYRLFAYNPFYSYMLEEHKAKNISRYLELLQKYQISNQIFEINKSNIEDFVVTFFYDFIDFIRNQKISEFDEDTKIPAMNSISMLTIHSSKGMEYPIVIMGSMTDAPFNQYTSFLDNLLNNLIKEFGIISDYEPEELTNILDFYRKFYTGFSRAKDLLILTYNKGAKYKENDLEFLLDDINEIKINELNIEADELKESIVKSQYSYTTDISVYNKCPLEYYYRRKLKFTFPKTKALFYGSLVHESIEAINKRKIQSLDIDNIEELVTEKARQKFKEGAIEFRKNDLDRAIEEVKIYIENLKHIGIPKESELGITFSTNDYLINGNVDMIYEKDGKMHIMDFKTGTPPDEDGNHESLKDYINQINLYAYLYKMTKGKEIDSMSLYFTDLDANQRIFTYKFDERINEEVLNMIDETVKNIESEKFGFDNCQSKSLLSFFMNRYMEEKNEKNYDIR
ncbi:MAG: ATP-dependent DNA helicase [Helcococcus sp.]|nr:ATP-dependent DNA helicase [Helcococcus sp.]